jgi:Tfp pilus assembly protein PilX
MKTQLSRRSTQRGTSLLVALFLTTILAVTIAGYLKHAQQQQYISARSQVWNASLIAAEAGIEEALQHLNTNTNNLAADGWVQSGTTYTLNRTLTSTLRYRVTINAANPGRPVITSQAFISSPVLAASSWLNLGFAQISSPNYSVNQVPPTITRAVRVEAGRNGMFQKAMVARRTIDMNGNNVMTDSFDSSNPLYSLNGRYDPSRARDNGDVASNASIVNAVNLGNANIYGRVAVGPGGTVAVGSNGGVGTRLWQLFNRGIQPGYFSDDMNFTFPTITLPAGSAGWETPTGGTVTVTNFALGSATTTSATYPNPVPATGVITNVTYTTVNAPPNPPRYGTVTNYTTTRVTTDNYPAPGTYIGTVEVVGKRYRYNQITGATYTYPTYTYTYSYTTTNLVTSTKSYTYVLNGNPVTSAPRRYYVSSLSGSVLVRGNVQLVVGGNIALTGQDVFEVASDGQVEMWVGGNDVKFAGNGVANRTGYAQNFLLWGTDNLRDFSLNGNGEFTGVLVVPNAAVRLNGGGNSVQDFIGAIIADTITLNGHFKFHYDEALKNYRNNGRFLITRWDEVPASQLANN